MLVKRLPQFNNSLAETEFMSVRSDLKRTSVTNGGTMSEEILGISSAL